jgi:hypothetical protein
VLFGLGAGAALQSSSSVATQGVSQDVAAASSALNSTIRRFAGGTGGQVTTILLASYPVINIGRPRFPAFTLASPDRGQFCVAGAALIIVFGRDGRKAR